MGGRRKSDKMFWFVLGLLALLTIVNMAVLSRFNRVIAGLEEQAKMARFLIPFNGMRHGELPED